MKKFIPFLFLGLLLGGCNVPKTFPAAQAEIDLADNTIVVYIPAKEIPNTLKAIEFKDSIKPPQTELKEGETETPEEAEARNAKNAPIPPEKIISGEEPLADKDRMQAVCDALGKANEVLETTELEGDSDFDGCVLAGTLKTVPEKDADGNVDFDAYLGNIFGELWESKDADKYDLVPVIRNNMHLSKIDGGVFKLKVSAPNIVAPSDTLSQFGVESSETEFTLMFAPGKYNKDQEKTAPVKGLSFKLDKPKPSAPPVKVAPTKAPQKVHVSRFPSWFLPAIGGFLFFIAGLVLIVLIFKKTQSKAQEKAALNQKVVPQAQQQQVDISQDISQGWNPDSW